MNPLVMIYSGGRIGAIMFGREFVGVYDLKVTRVG